MNWTDIKQEIYFEDGSLRDIYIHDTTSKDWEKWISLVNTSFNVEFYEGSKSIKENQIDFSKVQAFWNGTLNDNIIASIDLDGIEVKCYFFIDKEIENDIDPKQIKSLGDHEKIIEYLKTVSKILNKKVILTPENSEEIILIKCTNNKITVPNKGS